MLDLNQIPLPFENPEKRAGQIKALKNVPDGYRMAFERVVRSLAATYKPFTSEDIIEEIGTPSEGSNRNNAIGALMSAAAQSGIIKKSGFATAKRQSSHGRIIHVWVGIHPTEKENK